MKISEMLNKAKKGSKKDDVPGMVDAILEEDCPNCGRKLRLFKPCCGAENGYKGCNCGYKVVL